MINRINEIISGWFNYLIGYNDINGIDKLRLNICNKCDKLRKDNTCEICGCYMPAKVKSKKSKCDLNNW